MIYPIGVYRPISRPQERDPNIQTHENADFRAVYSKKCVPVYLHTEAPKQQDTLNKMVFTCGRAYKHSYLGNKSIQNYKIDTPISIPISIHTNQEDQEPGQKVPVSRQYDFYKSVNQNDLFDSKYNKSIQGEIESSIIFIIYMSIIQRQYVYTLQTEYVRRRRNPKRDSRISYFT